MNNLVYLFLCFIWGTTWLAIKIGLQDAPALFSAAIRMLSASFILAIYALIKNDSWPKGIKNIVRITWPGLFMYGISYSFAYWGMQYIDSGMAVIFFATLPFFVIITALFFIKIEKISLRAILGVILGFLGILVIYNGSISLTQGAVFGVILFLLSSAISGFFSVYLKAYLTKDTISTMLAIQFFAAGCLILIFSSISETWSEFIISKTSIGSILYLTIFGSVFAFGGFYWLIRRMSALRMSLIAIITPIVALIAGYIILGEKLGIYEFIGSAIVLIGVLVVTIKKKISF